MGYNSHHKLLDNIVALRIALAHAPGDRTEESDLETLQKYSGFGGINAILYPDASTEEWIKQGATQQDLKLYAAILQLHQLLKDNFNEADYKDIVDSLTNSRLTAFYTPPIVPQTLYEALNDLGIVPQRIYEPSSGAGVFVTKAVNAFPDLEKIIAVEKDILTSKVLVAITDTYRTPIDVHASPFEKTSNEDNGEYDLIVSNIPFGNFAVYDPKYSRTGFNDRIHNYFFVKGLDKIKDGGLLAYITTDGFMNSPANKKIREHLFLHADFVSLAVLPDNLMKDTGGTEAPNHLLIVQKNDSKTDYSDIDQELINTVEKENEFGHYSINKFIDLHPAIVIGDSITAGKNQYGNANQSVWQDGPIESIGGKLCEIIKEGITSRLDKGKFLPASINVPSLNARKKLHYLDVPEKKEQTKGVQLGMFDTAPAANINRAMDYLKDTDLISIEKNTSRIIGTIKTEERPDHESIVLITAKARRNNNYYYKLFVNLEGIEQNVGWLNADELQKELNQVKLSLSEYDAHFKYTGERIFSFGEQVIEQVYLTGLKPHYREGTLVFHNETPGTIHHIDIEKNQSEFRPFTLNSRVASFYKEYIKIRDLYFELSAFEAASNTANAALREDLNIGYDRFIVRHGLLNQVSNKKELLNDALGFITLSSIERKDDEQYVRSDIFYKPLFHEREEFKTSDPAEALARCLNDKAEVDLEYIGKMLDIPAGDTIQLLADHIFQEPITRQWQTADKYLSGDVVTKLKQARQKQSSHPTDFQLNRSLQAIEKVQPEKIPFEILDFNFGERWIPLEFYSRFASMLFDQEVTVNFFGSVDSFKVEIKERNAKITEEYAIKGRSESVMNGNLIMEHALENTSPYITYPINVDGKIVRVPDNEAIQLAHQKIEGIRGKFVEWLKELPAADKKYIEQLYNDSFNCYVLREYNGSHLKFPGLDLYGLGITDLYSSQKNAAWRIVQNRGGLIDHEVGLGKTLTIVVAAHEMKRLGIVHKPMILGLKANIADIAATYRKAYPKDKVLFPSDDDFDPANRQRLFHHIKSNNWDCIILTHEQFGKIEQSPEIQQKIIQQELDDVKRDLQTMQDGGGELSKHILKGMEIRKNNLAVRLNVIADRIKEKKDTDITFEEMAIDHLFVDEAHKFKNLTFTTRHNRVAGLGNPDGSQRALNMLYAIRTLQERFQSDLNVTFLTGTPISNSLTELFLIFKFLRPNELKRLCIENFDAWAAVYAKKSVDFEFSVTNEIIAKERFREFIKVPELALFYNEVADYKTAEHIKLDKPALDEILVNIKPTADQEEFIGNLIRFANTGDGTLIGRGVLTKSERIGKMLIATNAAKKMAVDMRLINPSKYGDDPNNKVSVCARNIAEIFHESTPHRGTQLVFCDIGTPKSDEFNVYDALKSKLVKEHNIPANQIAFIHEWDTRKKRKELFKLVNAGRIRIVIGSTEKLGTGVNVQERMLAMHHLDIPWTPKDLEQRNGRGARQGNWLAREFYNNKVKNFIYATERTLDNYKFCLLKNKITFIVQLKNGDITLRTIDEGSIDKQSGMSYSEYIAILSGDTTLLEKTKVEKKISVLGSLRLIHAKQQSEARFRLESLQLEKVHVEKTLSNLKGDKEQYEGLLQYDQHGSKANPIQILGCLSSDPAVIGNHIIDLYRNWRSESSEQTEKLIGSLYGFDLYVQPSGTFRQDGNVMRFQNTNSLFARRGPDGIKYTYNNGEPNTENPALAVRYFINAIDRVDKLHEQYTGKLEAINKDTKILTGMIGFSFEKEEELNALKQELENLKREISMKNKKPDDTPAEGEETPVIEMKGSKKKICRLIWRKIA